MPDGDKVQNGNIALLIDADNASASGLDRTLTILAELGTVNIRRAYGNWNKPSLKGWVDMIPLHAIEPHQHFDITKGKNATDMKMTIDAMDLLYTSRVDGFGIMSSDSDFMPIAMRIRQNGIPVYGFGADKTPAGFRQACTRFIDLSSARQSASEPEQASASRPKVDQELVHLLSEAWEASKHDDDGFANLGQVGKLVSARSSFDARSYGFARLSDLVKSLDQFEVVRRDQSTFIKLIV